MTQPIYMIMSIDDKYAYAEVVTHYKCEFEVEKKIYGDSIIETHEVEFPKRMFVDLRYFELWRYKIINDFSVMDTIVKSSPFYNYSLWKGYRMKCKKRFDIHIPRETFKREVIYDVLNYRHPSVTCDENYEPIYNYFIPKNKPKTKAKKRIQVLKQRHPKIY